MLCDPATYHEFSYRIAGPPGALSSSEYPILHEKLDKLHYTYSIRTHLLTLKPMPSDVHNCLQDLIVDAISDWCDNQHVITAQERRRLKVAIGTMIKLQGIGTKEPDFAIILRDHDNGGFPMVVFEVAFSQPYRDLLVDAHEWLVGTDGLTRMCVVVSIEEDKAELNRIKNKGKKDAQHAADSEDSNDVPPEHTPPPVSSATIIANYKNTEDAIAVSSYVGPFTAYLEAYVLDSTTTPPSIKLASPRLTILPPPPLLSSLRLVLTRKILGLPPANPENQSQNDPDDEVVIDLSTYPAELIKARKVLAIGRMADKQTKRKRSPDYEGEEQQECREAKKKQFN